MAIGTILTIFYLFQEFDIPWEPRTIYKLPETTKTHSQQFNPVFFLSYAGIKFYQLTFSKTLGDVCNFEPSCSRYAYQSIQEYGLRGILMASDRLERCNYFAWHYVNKYYSVKETILRGIKLDDTSEPIIPHYK